MNSTRRRTLTVVALGVAIFASLSTVGVLERTIASDQTRIAQSAEQIALRDRHTLEFAQLVLVGAQIDHRLEQLHVNSDPARRSAELLRTIDRLCALRHAFIFGLRTAIAPSSASNASNATNSLAGDEYEVEIEGRYSAVLAVVHDLAREPLIIATRRLAFERLRREGRASSEVRAKLDLTVYHNRATKLGVQHAASLPT